MRARRTTAACWSVLLLAAALCDTAAAKGGRGGARGAARGARGSARARARAVPRYGSALRVAGAAAAGAAAGVAAGAALRRAQLPGDGGYGGANGTAPDAWTSAARGHEVRAAAWAVPWLCPLAALLRR